MVMHVDTGSQTNTSSDNFNENEGFECNICFDSAKNPVISHCGHLYCWPCLHKWLKNAEGICPVCKSGIGKDKVIPVFSRGGTQDPRDKTYVTEEQTPEEPIPQRPPPQRHQPPESTLHRRFPAFRITFGMFPFGQANFTTLGTPFDHHHNEVPLSRNSLIISRILLFIGFLLLILIFFLDDI